MAAVQITDIIVPQIFAPYVQQLTEQKSRLIQSGAVRVDANLSNLLGGGGLTFNEPSFKDLDDTADNVGTDNPATLATALKIGTAQEIQVRLSRNQSWSAMDLAAALAGADPVEAIASRVADYWVRRAQDVFVATITGVFADNAAAPSGTEHVLDDMTFDASGVGYVDGVTNFSAENFLDATQTMGDSAPNLSLVMMHSIVFNRAKKNNLIDFIPDSINPQAQAIPTFLGHIVVVDDHMPNSAGVFQTWIFGAGAVAMGRNFPRVPVETIRVPAAGNGSGQETLHYRVEWIMHPAGNAYVGTAASGGPGNDASSNNLANAGSWQRRWAERKMIRIARLITREYAV